MKKNTAYTIGSLIILLICAFVFVILPVFTGGAGANQSDAPSFGKYNGKEIRYESGSDFQNYVQQYGQMFQQYGQQMDSSTYYYIFNYAFDSTVLHLAYKDFVNASGYKVSDAAVKRAMLPYFYDETGKYSDKLYRQTPDSEKLNIKNNVTSSLLSQRYYDDNFGSNNDTFGGQPLFGLKESNSELDFLAAYGNKKRGFNMVVFSTKDYPAEEKIKFGKENAAKFNSYDMSVITVDEKATATKVAKRIQNGEITFEDAVTEYSDKNFSNSEGKLTNKFQYQIENILANKADLAKVVDLATDSVSEVIETTIGFSIFKANGDKTPLNFDEDSAATTIGNYMTNYEASVIEDYFTTKATDFTTEAMNTSFASACSKFNVEKVDVAPFPLNYGSVSVTTSVDTSVAGLAGADTNENFLKTAFGLKMNEISKPIVLSDNIVVLQYVTEDNTAETDGTVLSELENYDSDSSHQAIMSSSKLENNFSATYFKYFMN